MIIGRRKDRWSARKMSERVKKVKEAMEKWSNEQTKKN